MFLRIAIWFGLFGLVAACDVVPTSDTNTGRVFGGDDLWV